LFPFHTPAFEGRCQLGRIFVRNIHCSSSKLAEATILVAIAPLKKKLFGLGSLDF